MDHLWSPWRYQYVTTAGQAQDCIFCSLPAENRDPENYIVYRGRLNFVILNRYPYTSGHLMVVPYEHAPLLAEVAEETLMEMILLALAPRNGGAMLFLVCLANRLMSGIAEGMASGADEGGDVLGGPLREFGQHAGVGVGGDGDGRQAEGFLDDLHVVPCGQQQGGGPVAQVVQADGR